MITGTSYRDKSDASACRATVCVYAAAVDVTPNSRSGDFVVTSSGGRAALRLRAGSSEERDRWVGALERARTSRPLVTGMISSPPTLILPNLALVSFLVKNTPFPTIVFF